MPNGDRPSLDEIYNSTRPSLDELYNSGSQEPAPSALESGIRGGLQGITLGLGDEMSGGLDAAGDVITGKARLQDLVDAYKKHRDYYRARNEAAQKANPRIYGAGNFSGGIVSGLASGGAGLARAAGIGALGGLGYSNADNPKDLAKDTAIGGAVGGAVGVIAEKVAPAISKALGSKAEALAENATGATRRQAEEFAPGTGRFLLDKGIVTVGSSPTAIAERASEGLNSSSQEIGDILREAGRRGTSTSLSEMESAINKGAKDLAARGGNFIPAAKSMGNNVENIYESLLAGKVDKNNVPLEVLNRNKGSFGRTNWANPEVAQGQKETYKALMGLEEQKVATYRDLVDRFQAAKNSYHVLTPVEEFATKRALQLKQSPMMGLNDVASMGVGHLAGSYSGGILAPIARRILGPRTSSSLAVGADMASKALGNPSTIQGIRGGAFSAIENALSQKLDKFKNEDEAAMAFQNAP